MKMLTKLLSASTLALCLMLMLSSCSKENQNPAAIEDQLLPGEILAKTPKPGIYTITKFIDTGDDETSQFNGYTFQFKANGSLIATTGSGQVFNGSWSMNGAETVMTMAITGTAALDDLDDDNWNVVKITNLKIRLKKNGPDIVWFERLP